MGHQVNLEGSFGREPDVVPVGSQAPGHLFAQSRKGLPGEG